MAELRSEPAGGLPIGAGAAFTGFDVAASTLVSGFLTTEASVTHRRARKRAVVSDERARSVFGVAAGLAMPVGGSLMICPYLRGEYESAHGWSVPPLNIAVGVELPSRDSLSASRAILFG